MDPTPRQPTPSQPTQSRLRRPRDASQIAIHLASLKHSCHEPVNIEQQVGTQQEYRDQDVDQSLIHVGLSCGLVDTFRCMNRVPRAVLAILG